uniref:Uncharacterized protein n=1 Tax=Oryza rufipogon TaxID=4529 RepID=A0A0E0NLN7_ORYRU
MALRARRERKWDALSVPVRFSTCCRGRDRDATRPAVRGRRRDALGWDAAFDRARGPSSSSVPFSWAGRRPITGHQCASAGWADAELLLGQDRRTPAIIRLTVRRRRRQYVEAGKGSGGGEGGVRLRARR